MQKLELSKADIKKARVLYQKLFKKAFPHSGGIALNHIEIASFNRSNSLNGFKKVGLGLEVDVIYSKEVNKTNIGHTGKIVMNLPNQLLLEHQHVDTEVLKKNAKVPKGYTDINNNINNFKGIYDYKSNGEIKTRNGTPIYKFTNNKYTIVQSKTKNSKLPNKIKPVFHFEGKSETFHMMFGDALLMSDNAIILYAPKGTNPNRIPKELKTKANNRHPSELINLKRMLYLTPGTIVLLPKHCKHAILAGKKGAVYLEFSTPSLDEADVFTDTRVIR